MGCTSAGGDVRSSALVRETGFRGTSALSPAGGENRPTGPNRDAASSSPKSTDFENDRLLVGGLWPDAALTRTPICNRCRPGALRKVTGLVGLRPIRARRIPAVQQRMPICPPVVTSSAGLSQVRGPDRPEATWGLLTRLGRERIRRGDRALPQRR